MCDTLVATPEATADGIMLFGKNSDREPNEAQYVFYAPAANHPQGSMLRCTYIEIPQAAHTYAILLSRPFWMWGGEMGSNEHGVTIGNEAVFSKVPANTEKAPLGMDLLRLALERGKTARQALDVITSLLETYGQGGKAGYTRALYYHNSFIIADPREAWVLETVDRHWAAKKIQGVYTISNGLTLGSEWDLASPHLVSYAVERGWCKGQDDFDFAACYSDFIYTRFSASRSRCSRTRTTLQNNHGAITVNLVMAALRDHGTGGWMPAQGLHDPKVCMHAGFGPVRVDQSVASQVSHLSPDRATHFFTGTSAPCTSIFKPVWIDAPLPDFGPAPQGTFDPQTLFWRHERLHRATLQDYATRIRLYQAEAQALEADFVSQAMAKVNRPAEERAALAQDCFTRAEAAEAGWLERVKNSPVVKKPGMLYTNAWQKVNRQAHMPD